MNTAVHPIAPLLDAWWPEFVKSAEMFTGETPVAVADPSTPPAVASADVLWHEQRFSRNGDGLVWLGLPTEACIALIQSAADDADGRVALLREIVDQSLKATAQALHTGGFPGLQCTEPYRTDPPPASIDGDTTRWFRVGEGAPMPILIRHDRGLELTLANEPEAVRPVRPMEPSRADDMTPAFDRFIGVQMPVSVVLGRATLKIRDVLKLSVGALVELDARPSDPVDVCVHDTVVARGEVVSIRGNYGVKILEVMTQRERMQAPPRSRHASPAAHARPRVH
jgi:flagellar motor switch protein FliN